MHLRLPVCLVFFKMQDIEISQRENFGTGIDDRFVPVVIRSNQIRHIGIPRVVGVNRVCCVAWVYYVTRVVRVGCVICVSATFCEPGKLCTNKPNNQAIPRELKEPDNAINATNATSAPNA